MIVAVNCIRIEKGKGEDVAKRFAEPKAVHTFKGFVRMEVWLREELSDHDELNVCTTWESKEDFERWLTSRVSQKAHRQEGKVTNEENPILGNELKMYTVAVQHFPASQ